MVVSACAGVPTAPVPAPEGLGWASGIVEEPASFESLMAASDREAWIAVYNHDYRAAAGRVGPDTVVGLRARQAEAIVNDDLQRLTALGTERLYTIWAMREAPPEGLAVVTHLAARCAGVSTRALEDVPLLDGVGELKWTPGQTSEAGERHPVLESFERDNGLRPGPDKHPVLSAWLDTGRRKLLLRATEGGADTTHGAWTEPFFTDSTGPVERRYWEPCAFAALAEGARREAPWPPDLATWTDPAASLFAAWPTVEDLRAEAAGDPGFAGLGVAPPSLATWDLPSPEADDAGAAQTYIRALDARVEPLRRHLADTADADGQALLGELDPLTRWRQEHLVARARADLRAGRPHRARTTLLLARSVSDREIGPGNGPALLVLLAEANLRTGRTREALDALHVLARTRPEVRGLQETLGDLAVLEGLDRQGDSKEH